jgi:hypothetical protein
VKPTTAHRVKRVKISDSTYAVDSSRHGRLGLVKRHEHSLILGPRARTVWVAYDNGGEHVLSASTFKEAQAALTSWVLAPPSERGAARELRRLGALPGGDGPDSVKSLLRF